MDLKNNSKEMKTVVETFVMEETVELTHDQEALDKWNAMVEELGLEGQSKITSPKKSPNPFMYMNETLVTVAGTLCPKKEDVKSYNATPIPLDILELVAMSTREKYFNRIQIWYDEKSKDPFAIGISKEYYLKKAGSWDSHEDTSRFRSRTEAKAYLKANDVIADLQEDYQQTKHYLIGKWADVKMSFEELTAKAKKRFISEDSLRYERQIKEAQRSLDDIKLTANEKFGM